MIDKIERFGQFIRQQQRIMTKFKKIIDQTITNQVMLHQKVGKQTMMRSLTVAFFNSMSELEEVLAFEDCDEGSLYRS